MKKLIYTLAILAFTISLNAQWMQMSNGMNGETILSLGVNGTNIFAGTYQHGVYISANDGTTWTQTTLTNQSVEAIASFGNYIIAGGGGPGLFSTTNNGANWGQTMNYNYVRSLASNSNYVFAGTDGNGVAVSSNGYTWTQTSLIGQSIRCLSVNGSNIAAGTWGNGVYFSTDNGTSWTQTALNNQFVWSLAIIGNTIYAGTNGNGVYVSTNNGTSWNQTALNNKDVRSIVAGVNSVFAGTIGSGIYFSSNNGATWILKNQGFTVATDIHALITKSNYIFAGLGGYSVWRRLYSEAIGIKTISTEIPSSYSLGQNYPNPFNPTTKIRFEIPGSVSSPRGLSGDLVQLKVFDIMGREVATLVNEQLAPGTYETTFDGSALSSGTYFYKLTSGNFTQTKKLTLLK